MLDVLTIAVRFVRNFFGMSYCGLDGRSLSRSFPGFLFLLAGVLPCFTDPLETTALSKFFWQSASRRLGVWAFMLLGPKSPSSRFGPGLTGIMPEPGEKEKKKEQLFHSFFGQDFNSLDRTISQPQFFGPPDQRP